MGIGFLRMVEGKCRGIPAVEAEYAPFRAQLRRAGLCEEKLRRMDPDDRVAALERANLDPYDHLYLAWS